MDQLKCSWCFSTDVEIIGADAMRDLVTIRCRACGRTSDVDMERMPMDAAPPPRV